MKKVILSLSLLVSTISFAQSECCNVVDSAGVSVISSNGSCVITNDITTDCGEEKVAEVVPKVVEVAEVVPLKVELKESEKEVLMKALEGVKFKTNSDVLLPESYDKLDAVAELMKSNENYKLTVDGYTDNTGESAYNHALSLKRAEAAKARLIVDGISADRIGTHGYGEERPVDSNDTKEGRAKNRRVEFLISF